jgi:DNA-binding MarR family transcriptional regulator
MAQNNSLGSHDLLSQTVDMFWETFPSFWHKIRAHIREITSQRFEITVEQFHILRQIRKGNSSASQLADVKCISRPAISQALDILVNKGLISRQQDPDDRRCIKLVLSVQGEVLLDSIFNNTREYMMKIMGELTEADLQNLLQAMESLRKLQIL